MINRIRDIIAKTGLSNGEFSDKIGIQKSSLSHVLSGRNKPSLDFILKILEAYPSIDSDYLLFGRESNHISVTDEIIQRKFGEDSESVASDSQFKNQKNTNDSVDVDRIVLFYKNGSFEVFNSKE